MAFARNILIALFILNVALVVHETIKNRSPRNPDAGLDIVQLVQKHGYPLETHEVTTDDGYVLTLHRIPYAKNPEDGRRKIPVLVMHGMLQSATDFVTLGPGKALAFLLADEGYDVWLANARGTTWSRRHLVLDPDRDRQFWNFSFHEIGYHDLPANIDYILAQTSQQALHYIGYSQGTSVYFVLASERPEYCHKIRLISALGPALYLANPPSPLVKLLVFLRKPLQYSFDFFNAHEIFSSGGFISAYLKYICDERSIFVDVCLQNIYLLHGYSTDQTNKTLLSLVFTNMPAGISSRQLTHYLQIAETEQFHQLDLGPEDNLRQYQQNYPPSYSPERGTAPLALYYTVNDWTIHSKNIERIKKNVPNIVKTYQIPLKTFNHFDFLSARDVVDLLYKEVISEMSKY